MLVEDESVERKGIPLSEGGERKKMHVLVYGNQGSIVTDRLKTELYGVVPPERVEEYSTLESLSNGLRRPLLGRAIAVLLAASREDLSGLLSISDLLHDILVILILPDREGDTISTGHKLYPRYLTYADVDFADVADVLGKMLEIMDNSNICRKGGE
jgi:hypothetical protein